LRDLCDRFALDVSGAAGISISRLFGQAPSGLNANGESNLTNDDDQVKQKQTDLTAQMNKLDQVLVRSALGRMPPDYRSTWNPLRQMSDEQRSNIELRRAQRDAQYIDRKVVTREAAAVELKSAAVYPNFTDEAIAAAKEADEAAKKSAEKLAELPQALPPGKKPGNGLGAFEPEETEQELGKRNEKQPVA